MGSSEELASLVDDDDDDDDDDEDSTAASEAEVPRKGRAQWTQRRFFVESVNTTGEPAAKGSMTETAANVLLIQEAKIDERDVNRSQEVAGRFGWSVAYFAALRTSDLGYSGGTGKASRRGTGMRNLEALPSDVEYLPVHRFSAKVVNIVCEAAFSLRQYTCRRASATRGSILA